jgi:hypothetical protein
MPAAISLGGEIVIDGIVETGNESWPVTHKGPQT